MHIVKIRTNFSYHIHTNIWITQPNMATPQQYQWEKTINSYAERFNGWSYYQKAAQMIYIK